MLLWRPWRDVGEMGVGGGGPGVSLTIGVEGAKGLSESSSSSLSSSLEEEASSSQLSATGALVILGLLEGEMESFLRDDSRPECWLGRG